MASDKREHPRMQAAFQVELSLGEDQTVLSKTRDISEGGAFVITKEQDISPELHMRLTVRVMGLPTGPGEPVQCEVVRLEEEGCGVRFLSDKGDS